MAMWCQPLFPSHSNNSSAHEYVGSLPVVRHSMMPKRDDAIAYKHKKPRRSRLVIFKKMTDIRAYKSEEQHVKVVFKTMYNHLAIFAKNFKKNFLDEDNLIASYEWIMDLFQGTPEGLATSEEEIFIDFTPSEKLKGNFVVSHSPNLG
ncbi:zinc finger BED domain-containing protein 5 [Trichonephila clavipes]|nr:zinc finger BED domain-containing protein 5 [Trichonephila clavipes]